MIRALMRRAAGALAPIYRCAGWFTHRGVRVWHPGAVVEQATICGAVDAVAAKILDVQPMHAETLAVVMASTWIRLHDGATFDADGAPMEARIERLGGGLLRGGLLVRLAAEPHATIGARATTQLARAWGRALGMEAKQ